LLNKEVVGTSSNVKSYDVSEDQKAQSIEKKSEEPKSIDKKSEVENEIRKKIEF
jgi:hypothetical protein